MLLGIRNVFGDFAYGHTVKVRGAERIQNFLYPVGDARAVELSIIVGHKQQDGRSDASA